MGCCWLIRGLLFATAFAAVLQPGTNLFNPSNLFNPFNLLTPVNIVLVHADDLGYGDLGSYGQTRFATPHLDRLAREGTRFTQYYAGSTVCAPSRGRR
jgi:arylsulfatase A